MLTGRPQSHPPTSQTLLGSAAECQGRRERGKQPARNHLRGRFGEACPRSESVLRAPQLLPASRTTDRELSRRNERGFLSFFGKKNTSHPPWLLAGCGWRQRGGGAGCCWRRDQHRQPRTAALFRLLRSRYGCWPLGIAVSRLAVMGGSGTNHTRCRCCSNRASVFCSRSRLPRHRHRRKQDRCRTRRRCVARCWRTSSKCMSSDLRMRKSCRPTRSRPRSARRLRPNSPPEVTRVLRTTCQLVVAAARQRMCSCATSSFLRASCDGVVWLFLQTTRS